MRRNAKSHTALDVRDRFGDDRLKFQEKFVMRWDDFRRSDNVEDDRGSRWFWRRRWWNWYPGRRRRPRDRNRCRSRPDRLGAWHRSEHPDRRRRTREQRTALPTAFAAERAGHRQPKDQMGDFVAAVLGNTEDTWSEIFKNGGQQYSVPRLRLYSGALQGGCGLAQAAMGPFYCPNRSAHLPRYLVLPRYARSLSRLQR